MKITVVKVAQKHAPNGVCPWMVGVPPEGKK
jgi:hypothetical protein